jgi:hypothetical protein
LAAGAISETGTADAEGLGPFDLAPELSPGSPAAGPDGVLGAGLAAELPAGEGVVEPAGVEAAGEVVGPEVVAGATAAGEPLGPPSGPAGTGSDALATAEPDTEGPDADREDAVHPAVTRTGTSTSAAAIRRIRPSSRIRRRWGPV